MISLLLLFCCFHLRVSPECAFLLCFVFWCRVRGGNNELIGWTQTSTFKQRSPTHSPASPPPSPITPCAPLGQSEHTQELRAVRADTAETQRRTERLKEKVFTMTDLVLSWQELVDNQQVSPGVLRDGERTAADQTTARARTRRLSLSHTTTSTHMHTHTSLRVTGSSANNLPSQLCAWSECDFFCLLNLSSMLFWICFAADHQIHTWTLH